MLTELSQSSNMFRFQEGKSTNFKEDGWKSSIALMADPNTLPSDIVGCGGVISVNFSQRVSYPTDKREKETPWYIVFGHELKHASNANNGVLNAQPYDPYHEDSNLSRVSKDEQSAMVYENYLRKINNLPLRTAYSTYNGTDFFPVANVNSLPYIPNR